MNCTMREKWHHQNAALSLSTARNSSVSIPTGRSILAALVLLAALNSCSSSSDSDASPSSSDSAPVLSSASERSCSAIGWKAANGKVANGATCEIGENPETSPIVRIYTINSATDQYGVCTGTVIDAHTILTAAHCFAGEFDSVQIDTTLGTSAADRLIVHPNFGAMDTPSGQVMANDVALLIDNEALPVAPASILYSREPAIGEEAIVAGFGQTTSASDTGVMNAGAATVKTVTPNHVFLVFENDESHPCQGDSGGPLLLKEKGIYAIAGIVSQSDPTISADQVCSKGDVTLYTNTQNASVFQFISANAPNASIL